MKTEEEVREQLEALKRQRSTAVNMNFEIGGAKEALEWVLEEKGILLVGYR